MDERREGQYHFCKKCTVCSFIPQFIVHFVIVAIMFDQEFTLLLVPSEDIDEAKLALFLS